MVSFSSVRAEHVLAAIREADRLGREEFLATYHFGPARDYVLNYDGRDYDSKAVLGVAHRFATGTVASASEFSGGRFGAAKVLRGLGFIVGGPEERCTAAASGSRPPYPLHINALKAT